MKRFIPTMAVLGMLALTASAAVIYTPVSYDEVLFQTDGVANASLLRANVWMGVDVAYLWVKVQNISPEAAGSSAGVEWSGISFNLPEGVGIRGGGTGATPAPGSTLVGGSLSAMLPQWGWNYRGGAALGGGAMDHASFSYNAAGSTMRSTAPNSFWPRGNVNGMNYGGISVLESDPPGHPHIIDTIEVKFVLTGTVPPDLISRIDSAPIAVHFGSPQHTTRVPDNALTVGLLGLALAGIGLLARRW